MGNSDGQYDHKYKVLPMSVRAPVTRPCSPSKLGPSKLARSIKFLSTYYNAKAHTQLVEVKVQIIIRI